MHGLPWRVSRCAMGSSTASPQGADDRFITGLCDHRRCAGSFGSMCQSSRVRPGWSSVPAVVVPPRPGVEAVPVSQSGSGDTPEPGPTRRPVTLPRPCPPTRLQPGYSWRGSANTWASTTAPRSPTSRTRRPHPRRSGTPTSLPIGLPGGQPGRPSLLFKQVGSRRRVRGVGHQSRPLAEHAGESAVIVRVEFTEDL
jgi:hypothetical protein